MSTMMSKLKGKERKSNHQAMENALEQQEDENNSRYQHEAPHKTADQHCEEVDLEGPKSLCKWLSEVVNTATARIHNMSTVHEIPRKLEMELEAQVEELLQLRREAADSLQAAKRIAFQIKAVKAAMENASQTIRNAKADEEKKCAELADACWKPLRGRWLSLKNKRNQSELHNFLEAAKQKRKGLELLEGLAQARLEKLAQKIQEKPKKPLKKFIIKPSTIPEGCSEDGDDESSSDDGGTHIALYMHKLTYPGGVMEP